MTADEAMRVLKERTSLDVAPSSIVAAIQSQPGDVEAAVKQVIDWFVSGEARSKKAGTLLLAALRSQARSPQRGSTARKTDWGPYVEDAQRLLPSEHVPFVIGAIQVIRLSGQTPTAANVRARLEAEGRTKKQLLALPAAHEGVA